MRGRTLSFEVEVVVVVVVGGEEGSCSISEEKREGGERSVPQHRCSMASTANLRMVRQVPASNSTESVGPEGQNINFKRNAK